LTVIVARISQKKQGLCFAIKLVSIGQRDVKSWGPEATRIATRQINQKSLIGITQFHVLRNNGRFEVTSVEVSECSRPIETRIHGLPSSQLRGAGDGRTGCRRSRSVDIGGGRWVQKIASVIAAAVVFVGGPRRTVFDILTRHASNPNTCSIRKTRGVHPTALNRSIAPPSVRHCFGFGAKAATNLGTVADRITIRDRTGVTTTVTPRSIGGECGACITNCFLQLARTTGGGALVACDTFFVSASATTISVTESVSSSSAILLANIRIWEREDCLLTHVAR